MRILAFHQSADLYGSDRSFLDLFAHRDFGSDEVIVFIPEAGELERELLAAGLEVHVVPLLKIDRRTWSARGLARLVPLSVKSVAAVKRVVGRRRIDLVYTNTLAVWTGAIVAWRLRLPHLWRVCEIIRRPRTVAWTLRRICGAMSDAVIGNSIATRDWLAVVVRPRNKVSVVWNGVDRPPGEASGSQGAAAVRQQLRIEPNVPLVLVVGRINAWKGQDLAIDGVEILWGRGVRDFHVVFVGGPPANQPEYLESLSRRILQSPAASQLHLQPFTADVSRFYAAADVVLVPSREPEPFGRVAIEAMSIGLPVIAAAHGGLIEIVEDRRTGILFRPNDAQELADALAELTSDPVRRREMGNAGRERQSRMFSLQAYVSGMRAAFRLAIDRSAS